MTIPIDRKLVQESLEQIAKGPEALMSWAKEHQKEIDQKFINQLHRMVEYCQKNNQESLGKTFTFLEQCFQRMFPMEPSPIALAITKENFRENFDRAVRLLSVNKPQASLGLLHTLSVFLGQCPMGNFLSLVEANMGLAHAQMEQWTEAKQYLDKSIQSTEIGEMQRAKILANLAMIYRQQKQYFEASKHYHMALELVRKNKDQIMEFSILNNLAIVFLEQKTLPRCWEIQEQAYELAQKLNDPKLLKDCLARMAVIQALQGNADKCREFCQKGLKNDTSKGPGSSEYLELGLE